MRQKSTRLGFISLPATILVLAASLIGIVAGYKAVQKPTNVAPFAQQLQCANLNQYPNRKCEETLPGPCTYGAWKYQCTGSQGPCLSDAGVGVPYWCDGNLWHNMNFYGECTTVCKPNTDSQPNPPPTSGKRCFYLTAEFNKTAQGDFDAWVTFNTDDTNPDYHDIKLDKNGQHVAGYNRWNRPTPFTYWPEHTGGRIPANTTVTFTGYDDNCGDRGNRSSVVCTVKQDGTVSGAGCSLRFGQSVQNPTATPTPTPPPSSGGQITPPPPTATPTPVRPTERIGVNLSPPPTSIPFTPTPSSELELIPIIDQKPKTDSQPNILTQTITKIKEVINKEERQTEPLTISGQIKINNTLGVLVDQVQVLLYENPNDQHPKTAEISNNQYVFTDLEENKNYIIKAWAKVNNDWYQNTSCSLANDPYDCIVKTGDKKNLEIDIGPQGLNLAVSQIQKNSQKLASGINQLISNIPVVGPLINMFFISAF